jgi:hypothetical protein
VIFKPVNRLDQQICATELLGINMTTRLDGPMIEKEQKSSIECTISSGYNLREKRNAPRSSTGFFTLQHIFHENKKPRPDKRVPLDKGLASLKSALLSSSAGENDETRRTGSANILTSSYYWLGLLGFRICIG